MKNLDLTNTEIKNYKLYIPFNEHKERARCKRYLSPKWNSNLKCWEVNTSLAEIKSCNLHEWLKTDEISKEKKISDINDTFGTGAVTTFAKAHKYGYDAIEN